ncbi:MAG: Gfo/Idh/MocA family oxidoreductase, partial [Candidatus Bathyarchaeia archaeon]
MCVTQKAFRLEELKVGIIGCGAVAETCHLPAAKRISNVRIEALADINEERAKKVAERFKLKNVSIY